MSTDPKHLLEIVFPAIKPAPTIPPSPEYVVEDAAAARSFFKAIKWLSDSPYDRSIARMLLGHKLACQSVMCFCKAQ